ncbi:MAG: retropepsin-like aspartic protease [Phycisphaerales bacterium]|jgi:predicted aspartyl protease|nr:retropepsin-like aspartic protease [Phycisphaerales bacterium]
MSRSSAFVRFALVALSAASPLAHAQGGAPASIDAASLRFETGVPSALDVKRAPTGHLLVRPQVNGHDAGWFIFDTGAGMGVVSTPHVEHLGLTPAGSIDAVGVGGATGAPLFACETLSIGPVTLAGHTLMGADLSFLKPHLGEEIVGVLGYDVLSRCVAEIDLADSRIALHDPASYTLPEGAAWQPLFLEGRVPSIDASFEGHEGRFRLDTGANGGVTFHEPCVRELGLVEGREVSPAKIGGVGGFVDARSGTIEWFELAGVRHERVPAMFAMEPKGTFADATKAGNIGGEILSRYVLVFDYPSSRIAFVPRPERKDAGERPGD